MIPVGNSTRRKLPPHSSHTEGPSSCIEWITSVTLPQARH
jgi:hypothetical protein